MIDQLTFSGRTLAILSPKALDEVRSLVSSPFAAMVPAIDDSDREQAVALARDLVQMGCAEVCCVGPLAEVVHDMVDEVVEDAGALSVVTTWHADVMEGCQYFISAAGGRPWWLVAVVAEQSSLAERLRAEVKAE